MKPIVLVTGVPHSMTSMVTKFLLDNGGYCPDLWDDPQYDLPYSRYESYEIQKFLRKKWEFKNYDITKYFDSLPEDKVCVIKAPRLIEFINDINYSKRPIKVVYVMRNPRDIILSSIDKSGRTFDYYFNRIQSLYTFMVWCKFKQKVVISERIAQKRRFDCEDLLNYVELDSQDINFDGIDTKKIGERKPTYLKYRISIFLLKRLRKLF